MTNDGGSNAASGVLGPATMAGRIAESLAVLSGHYNTYISALNVAETCRHYDLAAQLRRGLALVAKARHDAEDALAALEVEA